jgi:hypothetical protein
VTLFAQEADSLRLSGRVTDSTGAGLASSELEIVNVNTKEKLSVTSAADGRYEAPITRAGNYAITIKKEGFADQTTNPVDIRNGAEGATLNITMLPAAVSTTITVTAGEAALRMPPGK